MPPQGSPSLRGRTALISHSRTSAFRTEPYLLIRAVLFVLVSAQSTYVRCPRARQGSLQRQREKVTLKVPRSSDDQEVLAYSLAPFAWSTT